MIITLIIVIVLVVLALYGIDFLPADPKVTSILKFATVAIAVLYIAQLFL